MTAICFEYSTEVPGTSLFRGTPAVSESLATRMLQEAGRHYLETAIGQNYLAASELLLEVASEASAEGWDGYHAQPVSLGAVHHAGEFLRLLSPATPTPDVSIDPDGEVSLEWYRAHQQSFTVSIGATGRLSYAGVFGESRIRGSEAYFSDGVPESIRASLRRLYAQTRS